MDTKFESIIPRLLAAYERGRLVPFVGSGLSYPNCHLWPEFVKRLEKAAKIAASEENPSNYDEDDSDALIRQANTAVRKLRARNPDLFAWEVRKALWTKKRNTPPATASLAGIWWPLVLTTNYDDLLLTDFREKQHPRQMDIVGRSAADCQRILTSLNSPSRALLWALQGFFGGPPGSDDGDLHQLKDELVVGHEEYRRVTHRALHFQRAFAEVYQSRQLFFLGSGLKEHYLRDLFNEILEVYGPCVYHHYALVKRGELNPDFMEANFQIKVIEYDDHAQVHKWLDQLGEAIKGERYKTVRWTYACQSQPTLHSVDQKIHIELVRSSLPTHLDENECLAVSAGGKGDDYFFSVPIQDLLDRMGLGGVKPATIEASVSSATSATASVALPSPSSALVSLGLAEERRRRERLRLGRSPSACSAPSSTVSASDATGSADASALSPSSAPPSAANGVGRRRRRGRRGFSEDSSAWPSAAFASEPSACTAC